MSAPLTINDYILIY